MKKNLFAIFIFSGLSLFSIHGATPTPVKEVDLNRYVGKWYEIAKIPQIFQAGCVGATAEYALAETNSISVKNSCYNFYLRRNVSVKGIAKVVDDQSNAKLKVKFFRLSPSGDYWIIELAKDYSWAVVGEPSQSRLWILSRKPQMQQSLYDLIIDNIKRNHGYDIGKIKKTYQLSTVK